MKLTDTAAFPGAADTPVGAPGKFADGVVGPDGADAAPEPTALRAVTVHVYVLAFVNADTVIGAAVPVAAPAVPPSDETHDAV